MHDNYCYFKNHIRVKLLERLMGCLTALLFIVILTTVSKVVTSLHCSDQQLPASGDDLQ